MLEYVSQDEVRIALRKSSLTTEEAADIDFLREAVSRAVEDDLQVGIGYYIPPATDPTTKIIRGLGDSYLSLPSPVFGTVTVTAPSGNTIPNFTVEGVRLIALDADGTRSQLIVFTYGIPYSITGRWGYDAIPPQLKEACIQIITGSFRERPENGFIGLVGGNMQAYEGVIRRGWPSSARTILNNLRLKPETEAQSSSLYIA
jgi:hypothetical protein